MLWKCEGVKNGGRKFTQPAAQKHKQLWQDFDVFFMTRTTNIKAFFTGLVSFTKNGTSYHTLY